MPRWRIPFRRRRDAFAFAVRPRRRFRHSWFPLIVGWEPLIGTTFDLTSLARIVLRDSLDRSIAAARPVGTTYAPCTNHATRPKTKKIQYPH